MPTISNLRGLGCGDDSSCGCKDVEEGLAGILGDLGDASGYAQCLSNAAAIMSPGGAGIVGASSLASACAYLLNQTYSVANPNSAESLIIAGASPAAILSAEINPVQDILPVPVVASVPTAGTVVAASMNPTPAVSQTIQQTQTSGSTGTGTTTTSTTTSSDNPVLDWLGLSNTPSASLISGIPNWGIVLAGVGLLFFMGGEK